jgi:hypothetical protein
MYVPGVIQRGLGGLGGRVVCLVCIGGWSALPSLHWLRRSCCWVCLDCRGRGDGLWGVSGILGCVRRVVRGSFGVSVMYSRMVF